MYDKEKARLRMALYRQTHREEEKLRVSLYRKTNKEKIRKYKKKYAQEHKENIKEYKKQYHMENKELESQKHKEYRKTPNGRMATYVRTAKKTNKIFALTIEKFTELTSQKCDYCGGKSENRDYCGIDRVNSKIGYVEDNCVPCCDFCNYSKQDLSRDQFMSHMIKILTYQGYKVERKEQNNQEFCMGDGI